MPPPRSLPPIETSCFWLADLPRAALSAGARRRAARRRRDRRRRLHRPVDGALPEGARAREGGRPSRRRADRLRRLGQERRPDRRDLRPLARRWPFSISAKTKLAAWPCSRGRTSTRWSPSSNKRRSTPSSRASVSSCSPSRKRTQWMSRSPCASARRLGIDDWQTLDGEATRRRLGSPLPLCALFAPRAATVHPAKLASGLARVAEARGVRIYEHSPVDEIHYHGTGLRLRTERGAILAPRTVLATNAYSHHLIARLTRRFLPLYDYVIASEPLDAKQRKVIRWQGREGVTDFRSFFNYSRLTADHRVVWGSSEAVFYRGNGVGPAHDHAPAVYAALEASFARFFPDLGEIRFPFRWGGPIAATTRFTPFFGALHSGPPALRTRLHRARCGDDPGRRPPPRPPGPREEERARRARPGPQAALSLPARAAAPVGDRRRNAGAAQSRRRRHSRPSAAYSRPDGDRFLELALAGREPPPDLFFPC